AGAVDARFDVGGLPGAPRGSVQAVLRGLRLPQLPPIDRVSVSAAGDGRRLRLEARGAGVALAAHGLLAAGRIDARLDPLQLPARSIGLRAPAALRWRSGQLDVGPVSLSALGGELWLRAVVRPGAEIQPRVEVYARASGLAVPRQATVSGTMQATLGKKRLGALVDAELRPGTAPVRRGAGLPLPVGSRGAVLGRAGGAELRVPEPLAGRLLRRGIRPGPVTFELSLDGTLARPRTRARLDLHDLRLRSIGGV